LTSDDYYTDFIEENLTNRLEKKPQQQYLKIKMKGEKADMVHLVSVTDGKMVVIDSIDGSLYTSKA
jgi:hypothetical protein